MQQVCKHSVIAAGLIAMAGVSPAERQPTEGYLPRFSRRVELAKRGRIPLRVSFPRLPGIDELPATFGVPL